MLISKSMSDVLVQERARDFRALHAMLAARGIRLAMLGGFEREGIVLQNATDERVLLAPFSVDDYRSALVALD